MTTPATQTLADWLLARIAEDEAAARAATPGEWTYPGGEVFMSGPLSAMPHQAGQMFWGVVSSSSPGGIADRLVIGDIWDAWHEWSPATADMDHIARHDPARVLAECAAMRRIVEWHLGESFDPCTGDGAEGLVTYPVDECPHLRALASVYADRDGWREEWRA